MKKIARICVIGNGHFANIFHYPSLAALDKAEIVGICETILAQAVMEGV